MHFMAARSNACGMGFRILGICANVPADRETPSSTECASRGFCRAPSTIDSRFRVHRLHMRIYIPPAHDARMRRITAAEYVLHIRYILHVHEVPPPLFVCSGAMSKRAHFLALLDCGLPQSHSVPTGVFWLALPRAAYV